jgi:hypothetical protein
MYPLMEIEALEALIRIMIGEVPEMKGQFREVCNAFVRHDMDEGTYYAHLRQIEQDLSEILGLPA